jgi:hypothetical protein
VSLLAAVAAVAMTPAMAQSGGQDGQIIVKVGLNLPTKNDVNSASKTWVAGGLEYVIGNPEARSVNSLELLYTAASGNNTPDLQQEIRERYRVWSLMVNHKVRMVPRNYQAGDKIAFYGAGLGADITRASVDDPNPGGEGHIDAKNTVGAGALFVGYEFSSNFQLEARYHISFGEVAGRKMNGIQLLAGLKF